MFTMELSEFIDVYNVDDLTQEGTVLLCFKGLAALLNTYDKLNPRQQAQVKEAFVKLSDDPEDEENQQNLCDLLGV